jgi:hypothetical protein
MGEVDSWRWDGMCRAECKTRMVDGVVVIAEVIHDGGEV